MEREERKASEARSKAKPVKRALRNMNDGKDPVTVDELLALAALHVRDIQRIDTSAAAVHHHKPSGAIKAPKQR